MKTEYFKTYESAQEVMSKLSPFEPSKYVTENEIKNGDGKARIIEFDKGFVIQLGFFGNYYPHTQNRYEKL